VYDRSISRSSSSQNKREGHLIKEFRGSIADAVDLIKWGELSLSMASLIAKDPSKRLFTKVPHNIFYRKNWEYLFILKQFDFWAKGKNNISAYGFGCGLERLPLFFCDRSKVIVTDAPPDVAKDCWKDTKQYLDQSFYQRFGDKFNLENISFDWHDMKNIDLTTPKQDFIWSASSLEHLGSIEESIKFVVESSKLLTERGIAVHCTEYNMSSNEETRTSGDSVYFRHTLHPYNSYVDKPPYLCKPSHMRVWFDSFKLTSFGFIVKRA
jgi:hypothetical protein